VKSSGKRLKGHLSYRKLTSVYGCGYIESMYPHPLTG